MRKDVFAGRFTPVHAIFSVAVQLLLHQLRPQSHVVGAPTLYLTRSGQYLRCLPVGEKLWKGINQLELRHRSVLERDSRPTLGHHHPYNKG